MRIRLCNPPATIVNFQLGFCVATDFARALNRVLLGVEVPDRARRSTTTNIPSATRVRHNVMRARFLPAAILASIVLLLRESEFAFPNLLGE